MGMIATTRRTRGIQVTGSQLEDSMHCEGFLARYSEYRDGLLRPEEKAEFETHVRECTCCARYHRVMEEGLHLLSRIPAAESSEDFMPRLRHRLYGVDAGIVQPLGGRLGGSAALIGVAAVGLLALFWLPFASTVPMELELPPVAVQGPPPGAAGVPALFRQGPFVSTVTSEGSTILGRESVEWPPRSHTHPTVILVASFRLSEPTMPSR